MEHKGALKVASPLEVLHAQWMAMHRDCTADKVEALVLNQWLVMACSCVVTFKLLDDPGDIMLYQDNLREEMIATAQAVTRTGLQRILQVAFAKPLIESRVGEGVLSNARETKFHI